MVRQELRELGRRGYLCDGSLVLRILGFLCRSMTVISILYGCVGGRGSRRRGQCFVRRRSFGSAVYLMRLRAGQRTASQETLADIPGASQS